jgi:hypothetical protein
MLRPSPAGKTPSRSTARQAHDARSQYTSRQVVRVQTWMGTSIAVAALGLTAWSSAAVAGKMDALLGDWDLNIAKSIFRPNPPMKKYTMKVLDAGEGRLLIKSDWIDADGTVGHVEYSTALDGKPITIIDYPIADTVTDTMVNETTWKSMIMVYGVL